MLTVCTWDVARGVHVRVEGHACVTTDQRGTQVCAGVSALMMTLLHVAGEKPEWLGDGSGLMVCEVPFEKAHYLEFVLQGFHLIEESYPGNIVFQRQDFLATRKGNGNATAAE